MRRGRLTDDLPHAFGGMTCRLQGFLPLSLRGSLLVKRDLKLKLSEDFCLSSGPGQISRQRTLKF